MRKMFESLESRQVLSLPDVYDAEVQPLHLDDEDGSVPLSVEAGQKPKLRPPGNWLGAADPEFFVPFKPN